MPVKTSSEKSLWFDTSSVKIRLYRYVKQQFTAQNIPEEIKNKIPGKEKIILISSVKLFKLLQFLNFL